LIKAFKFRNFDDSITLKVNRIYAYDDAEQNRTEEIFKVTLPELEFIEMMNELGTIKYEDCE
jgi:hypothetical protein